MDSFLDALLTPEVIDCGAEHLYKCKIDDYAEAQELAYLVFVAMLGQILADRQGTLLGMNLSSMN